ncbi:hypothetical protein PPTG_12652 [Phytophthora nicotianae INRA-310]|uniref:RxLR effector protein n=2 Tax=Phytophthora nicotianae TaxID=4792 RepID=W2Q1X2_PHYN3|nr:hypothetical protein PPTG_12652 [Phytophthora nicotianae INRA-310]ETI43124.1 hypothetical protein F443_11835 [Phytophthora nicotianae P1569]ETN06559.1 hypothetical protein PPTG_12652 [Phytophthora nicotianae INRA-310]
MRLLCLVVLVASSFLANGEAFIVDSVTAGIATHLSSGATQSTDTNLRGTRFLRAVEKVSLSAIEDDEERVPTMNFAGMFRDAKETRKWLQYWFNTGESAESVAAKLGAVKLSGVDAAIHENSAALAKYGQMLKDAKEGRKYAYFGTGYQTRKKTMEWLGKWALEEKSLEYVATQLKVLGKNGNMLKVHRNYNAIKAYKEILESVEKIRAKPV